MSESPNHHRDCSPGESGTSLQGPGVAREGGQGLSIRHLAIPLPLALHRLMSIDVKYQIWKFGVIFTDNVRRGPLVGEEL